MPTKPTVKIKNWGIYRHHPNSDNPWALCGQVIDHPLHDSNKEATTSSILKPASSELSKLKAGDTVETRNTIYLLIGDNQNGSN